MAEQPTAVPATVTIGGDRTVGPIGYGAMQLTGPKVWGDYPDHDQAIALLRAAVAHGVTFIDTADVYGPHSNEKLIREALHPYPAELVIATKGGFVRGGPEYSDMSAVGNKHYLRQAAYMSMRRLGLDHIALYYLHTPTMADAPFEQIIETLPGMRQDGLIHHIGRSNISYAPPCPSPTSRPSPSIQRGRPLRGGGANARPERGHRLLALASGRTTRRCARRSFPRCDRSDRAPTRGDPQQIALSWQLQHTQRSLPIPGTTSLEHLKENLAAARIRLTAVEVEAFTALVTEEA